MLDGKGIHNTYVPGTFRPLANKDNDYMMDRAAQKAGRYYSGVEGIAMQDASLQESMGPIVDRSKENLVSTDNGIIMARHRLLRSVKAMLDKGTIPPGIEMWARNKPIRVYLLHMGLFMLMLLIGCYFVDREGGHRQLIHSPLAIVPLLIAIFIRCGIAPFHCWMTDLFEHATFGTALLTVTPIVGAYAAVRLVLPIAPDWMLRSLGLVSL